MKQWVCLPFQFSKIWFSLLLWTCKLLPLYTIFSVPISIWEFFALCFATQVGLQFGTLCPNMSININVNFHTLRDCLISYNSMLNQIFIPWVGRKKQVYCFQTLWFHKWWRLRASPLFRAKLARHGLDRGRSSNGAPLQTRQAKFRSGLLIFLLAEAILQSPGELSPCLVFGESGSFLSGTVWTKPTIHSARACAVQEWWVPVGARSNHVEPGQIRVRAKSHLVRKSGDALRSSNFREC
jgi:hypothetical protein